MMSLPISLPRIELPAIEPPTSDGFEVMKKFREDNSMYADFLRDFYTSRPFGRGKKFKKINFPKEFDQEDKDLVAKLSVYIELLPYYLGYGNEKFSDEEKEENLYKIMDFLTLMKNRYMNRYRATLFEKAKNLFFDLWIALYPNYTQRKIRKRKMLRDMYRKMNVLEENYRNRGIRSLIRAILPQMVPSKVNRDLVLYEKVIEELYAGEKGIKDLYIALNTRAEFVDGSFRFITFNEEDWKKLRKGSKEERKEIYRKQKYSVYVIRNVLIGLRHIGVVEYDRKSRKYRLKDEIEEPEDPSVFKYMEAVYSEFTGALHRCFDFDKMKKLGEKIQLLYE